MEKQHVFDFAKPTAEEAMKEISNSAKKQLLIILDNIIYKGSYDDRDVNNIINEACWIERI